MSRLDKLSISSIRNIESAQINPSRTINLFYGENGSGKTSILESIHLLATGRSFRSSKIEPLIRHDAEEAVVFAVLSNGQSVGLSKSRRQNHQLKLQKEKQRNWENVARELPVQILDSSSFSLLEGGPKFRRRFLDWGVFHVEPSFVSNWRKSRKAIANRNQLLKQGNTDRYQLDAWERELCLAATEVDNARAAYFDMFLPLFDEAYLALDGACADELSVDYERGWETGKELSAVLSENRAADARYGATQHGPHRADISLRLNKNKAVDILSRGQQKILVSAMKIAQGKLFSQVLGTHCIYLVDDLPAELDRENREAVLKQLLDLGGQLFITCVDLSAVLDCLPNPPEMTVFHVEHGTITA